MIACDCKQEPTLAEALRQVVEEGWEEMARTHAQSALAALSELPEHSHDQDIGEQPEDQGTSAQKHIMLSCK